MLQFDDHHENTVELISCDENTTEITTEQKRTKRTHTHKDTNNVTCMTAVALRGPPPREQDDLSVQLADADQLRLVERQRLFRWLDRRDVRIRSRTHTGGRDRPSRR